MDEDYFIEKESARFHITEGYAKNGVLFYTSVIYKNEKEKPYAIYEKIDDEPGFYRRINSQGAQSKKWFDTFGECIKYQGEIII